MSAREQALLEAIDRLWDRIGCPELTEAIQPYELDRQSSEDLEIEEEERWSCPYCGEEDGEPITRTWREYQGVSPHGGMVDFQEEMCTKCAGRNR